MLWTSCSQPVPPMQRDFADAVTNINQVDPYYRNFFRSQNGSNYALSDQRRAYLAAMQTARTPVRASDYTRGVAEASRLASNKRSKAARGKKMASRRAIAKRGKAKSRSQAKNRKATASRKSTKSSSRRRRG